MMSLEDFTAAIQDLFVEGSVQLGPETRFRDNDEFDSLIGYAMLLVIQEHFGKSMSVPDFLSCHTVNDLYQKALSL